MGFRINTNVAAMNAHTNAVSNNRAMNSSLEKLSSGLRINKAADDSSGMAIADSLRMQANSLGQAISNANDGIGVIQIADKAMDEQLKILDTIKTKSIQAASDTQSSDSRAAIQKDVDRLLEQLDNIAKTTAYNGQSLLSGNFTNKEFQIGAYSNQTVKASIGNTQSLAIGNITSRTDEVAVGNVTSDTLTGKLTEGTETIYMSAAVGAGFSGDGLAQGDTIRIDGVGDYKITNIDGNYSTGTMSSAIITLDRGLEKSLSVGSTLEVSLVQTAAENLATMTTATIGTGAEDITISSTDITGFSVGDKYTFTTSLGETKTYTVKVVTGTSLGATSGTITLSSTDTIGTAGTLSEGSVAVNDRSSLGTDFTSDDYVQYTVGGTQLQGVQLTAETTVTKSDGTTKTLAMGVDQTGLGRVADLVNASTDQTGIKAVAVVEQNSNIKVQGGQLTSDIFINGERILDQGTTIKDGDTDNTLVKAINDKTNLTGVSATLESDGSLTLSSDGRAIVTDGMSGVAGINDGVHAGELVFTNMDGGNIQVSSDHFTDSGLVHDAQSDVTTLDELDQSNVLSDVKYGQVDDSGDGIIDGNDTVGLMLTKKGAMLAMDLAEAATKQLDSTRADLGSVQNQLTVTVNNISVTQVNVKAAESQIRDVDFAAESANFSKLNILAQSGSYAMSQANAVQQNVLKLLQ